MLREYEKISGIFVSKQGTGKLTPIQLNLIKKN